MTEEIVRVEAISKEFLGVTALSNVNLRLNKGEIHGLVGENAGKSTLINILAGAFRPSSFFIHKRETGSRVSTFGRAIFGHFGRVSGNGAGARFHSRGKHMAGQGRQQKPDDR